MEELAALHDPRCTQLIAEDRCLGILYTETRLADGTWKRTPTRSFPYNSLLHALGQLLLHVGITQYMQHWRCEGDEPVEGDVPPPLDLQEWFDRVGNAGQFSDATQAWFWRSQGTGLQRGFDGQEYGDEPTGNHPVSLLRLPLGLGLKMNLDGFQAHRGKFAVTSSYSINGVYIVVDNLPFYMQHLIENMILAIVIPGPKEPKGYAMDTSRMVMSPETPTTTSS
ncbi:hypothetical protein FRC06_001740 [Ceratobasidium sp. 370]|nr:hypothetical protein FRC06_001740 [Ceratobasidium sp. 370]